MNINTATVAGHLTRDVDTRFSNSGVAIANIGLAINRRTKRRDEWVDEPVFVDVKMFGKRAEAFAKYHKKGSPACFPNCELVFEQWEKDGDKRSKLVLHAQNFEFVGSKKQETADTPF